MEGQDQIKNVIKGKRHPVKMDEKKKIEKSTKEFESRSDKICILLCINNSSAISEEDYTNYLSLCGSFS